MMADYTYKELTVTTTAGDASNKIDFNPGHGESKFYVLIINTDLTNFIRVGFDSKRNADAEDIKVKAGETFVTSKAVQGLCFLADTSNVLIRYLILSGKPEADVIKATQTTSEAARTTLVAFVTDIPSASTRVQLASNTVVAGVLQAPSTNTSIVYIGGSNVSSTVFGAELQPGQSIGLAINNTNKIWIDAASDGDDAAFIGS